MAYCLLETIAGHDDVTPALAGRRRTVGPSLTDEASLRPVPAEALRAPSSVIPEAR